MSRLAARHDQLFLVRLKRGADIGRIRHKIETTIPGVEALRPAQFRDVSRSFWLSGTGAGVALLGGVLLGVTVGTVVVAQTIYSSTKDYLYNFATLRAIGCYNRYLYQVIGSQAITATKNRS